MSDSLDAQGTDILQLTVEAWAVTRLVDAKD
jgi:hypothetical protein